MIVSRAVQLPSRLPSKALPVCMGLWQRSLAKGPWYCSALVLSHFKLSCFSSLPNLWDMLTQMSTQVLAGTAVLGVWPCADSVPCGSWAVDGEMSSAAWPRSGLPVRGMGCSADSPSLTVYLSQLTFWARSISGRSFNYHFPFSSNS